MQQLWKTLGLPVCLLISFIASSTQAEQLFSLTADNKTQVNKKIMSKIRGFGSSFQVANLSDFQPVVVDLTKKYATRKPMVVQADFNGDKIPDLAILAKRKLDNGKLQIATFLALTTKLKRSKVVDYDVHVIRAWEQKPGSIQRYLSLNAQSYMDFTKAKINARDLIQIESLGGSTTPYFYLKRSSQKPSASQLNPSPHIYEYRGQFEK